MAGAMQACRGELERGIGALGLDVDAAMVDRLLAYGELLLKWNKVYNLSAIRSADELVGLHLLDSLAVLPCLGSVRRLVDVGSGAGLPGLVLAIVRPDMQLSSVETVGKKASFQQQAKIELGLGNVHVFNCRVEQLQPASLPGGSADAVISRAFSSLAEFVRLSAHLLGERGRLLAMKGQYPHEEVARLPAGWQVTESHRLQVPAVDGERHLLVLGRG